jgi:hypothetical protein
MNDKYIGMTVNERLFVSGLMVDFETAINEKDVNRIISILKAVDLSDYTTIDPILKNHGLKRDS